MNPGEKKTAKKISRILRAVRKQKGYNQTFIAKSLEISQSALSKLEAGVLIPSVHHWVEFCTITQTPTHSYLDGYIDHQKPAELKDIVKVGSFSVPARYGHDCGSTARASGPILSFFGKKLPAYLKSVGMDPDYFVTLDNQFNLEFSLDILRKLIETGALKQKDIPTLVAPVREAKTHGKLHETYDQIPDQIGLFKALVRNANFYAINNRYEIQGNPTQNKIEISMTPDALSREFDYKDETLGDFLCRYRKGYFQSFSQYHSKPAVEIKELECHFHGAKKCVYQIHANH